MGRIKTMPIKRVTNELFVKHKSEIDSDFKKNKELLPKLANIRSKKIKNIIAGYLTRLAKTKETV